MMREALADKFEQPPSLGRRILHAAQDMKMMMAMRMMRASGR
jgi:hypothetical protein